MTFFGWRYRVKCGKFSRMRGARVFGHDFELGSDLVWFWIWFLFWFRFWILGSA